MDKPDDQDILLIISTEMEQAESSAQGSEVDGNQGLAMSYYQGDLRGDEVEGRSQAVSTDVADAIEWILPQIVKAMISKGSVVSFDPMSEEDVDQAALETEFTHDVFMKENEGFLNLYEFIKDALLQKNGIFKIYYDETDTVKEESYDGLSREEMEGLLSNDNVRLIAVETFDDPEAMQQQQMQLQQMQQQLANVQDPQQQQQMQQHLATLQAQPPPVRTAATVEVTTTQGKVVVECVAPEDFRINEHHDSLCLDDARFTAHIRYRTKSELLEEGFDEAVISEATANLTTEFDSDYRFTSQGESIVSDGENSADDSQTILEIAECYMMIDADGSGKAKRMKITTLGATDPTDILDMEPIEESPFVSSSCIIMPHKFYGLSIFDRLKQLQDQKTSLWRNILDNLYLQNNREKEVVESQVNMDDLLVSRPGGVKRVKVAGAIRELEVQPIGQEGYQMLDYLDQVRTGRVGVSPETAGQVDALGTAVGSQGVERLQTAKEELTGLMVRAVAETGMKPAYVKIRDLLIRYQDSITAFKFRDQWQDVNPSQWGERSRTTVKVGTGTGDDAQKVGAIQKVIDYQAALMQSPENTLVSMPQIFEAMNDFCKSAGLPGADKYFTDPQSQEGQQKAQQIGQKNQQNEQQQKQVQETMAQAQAMLGKAETMKGQAALQSQQTKIQTEKANQQLDLMKQQSDNQQAQMKQHSENQQVQMRMQFEQDKAQLTAQINKLQIELESMSDGQKLKFDYEKLQTDEALKLTELEMQHQEELSRQYQANKQEDDDD